MPNSSFPRQFLINIFGSCVSRDILDFDSQKNFSLKCYIARQSIISAVSSQIMIDDIDLEFSSTFRKRMVLLDLEKRAFTTLTAEKGDYLLIDLIDERLPLVEISGSLATASPEFYEGTNKQFRQLNQLKKNLQQGALYAGDQNVEDCIAAFCKRIQGIYPTSDMILHRAKMVNFYETLGGEIQEFSNERLDNNRSINDVLDAMYQRFEQYLPGIQVIDEMNGTLATENHKWGLAPMHYHDAYYHRVLTRMYEIVGVPSNK